MKQSQKNTGTQTEVVYGDENKKVENFLLHLQKQSFFENKNKQKKRIIEMVNFPAHPLKEEQPKQKKLLDILEDKKEMEGKDKVEGFVLNEKDDRVVKMRELMLKLLKQFECFCRIAKTSGVNFENLKQIIIKILHELEVKGDYNKLFLYAQSVSTIIDNALSITKSEEVNTSSLLYISFPTKLNNCEIIKINEEIITNPNPDINVFELTKDVKELLKTVDDNPKGAFISLLNKLPQLIQAKLTLALIADQSMKMKLLRLKKVDEQELKERELELEKEKLERFERCKELLGNFGQKVTEKIFTIFTRVNELYEKLNLIPHKNFEILLKKEGDDECIEDLENAKTWLYNVKTLGQRFDSCFGVTFGEITLEKLQCQFLSERVIEAFIKENNIDKNGVVSDELLVKFFTYMCAYSKSDVKFLREMLAFSRELDAGTKRDFTFSQWRKKTKNSKTIGSIRMALKEFDEEYCVMENMENKGGGKFTGYICNLRLKSEQTPDENEMLIFKDENNHIFCWVKGKSPLEVPDSGLLFDMLNKKITKENKNFSDCEQDEVLKFALGCDYIHSISRRLRDGIRAALIRDLTGERKNMDNGYHADGFFAKWGVPSEKIFCCTRYYSRIFSIIAPGVKFNWPSVMFSLFFFTGDFLKLFSEKTLQEIEKQPTNGVGIGSGEMEEVARLLLQLKKDWKSFFPEENLNFISELLLQLKKGWKSFFPEENLNFTSAEESKVKKSESDNKDEQENQVQTGVVSNGESIEPNHEEEDVLSKEEENFEELERKSSCSLQ